MKDFDDVNHDHDQGRRTEIGETNAITESSLNQILSRANHESDKPWLAYLAGLLPDDPMGAFLLPDELPHPDATPQEAIEALETASRRAFLPTIRARQGDVLDEWLEQIDNPWMRALFRRILQFRERVQRWYLRLQRVVVTDPIRGTLDGSMSVLVPQGREHTFDFHNEPGWRANVKVYREEGVDQFTCYYTSRCMNPIRNLVYSPESVQVDSSRVTFTPNDNRRPMKIEHEFAYGRIWNQTIEQLNDQYSQVRRDAQD